MHVRFPALNVFIYSIFISTVVYFKDCTGPWREDFYLLTGVGFGDYKVQICSSSNSGFLGHFFFLTIDKSL